MTQHRFKWYLHDDDLWESKSELIRLNPDLTDDVIDYLVENNPFYEIEVEGFYDDVTGKIVLDKVK